MVIGIDHQYTHNVKYAPYVKVDGPQGHMLAGFFLATKAVTRLYFGMMIGIGYSNTHNGKSLQYVEGGGPWDLYLNTKGLAFSCQLKQPLDSGLVW